MKATIKDLTLSRAGGQILTFALDPCEDFTTQFDNLNGKTLDITVKQFREKRSLNANNYAWKLITELANALRTSKDEMYLLMLQQYGQSEKIELRADIDPSRYFNHYVITDARGDYIEYLVCAGSSTYDTREMSIFIDGIVSECKEQGIPTETPDEIERLKSLWATAR